MGLERRGLVVRSECIVFFFFSDLLLVLFFFRVLSFDTKNFDPFLYLFVFLLF